MKSEKAFLTLMASDLMTRAVVIVPQEMSLRGAARLLSRSQVSGAPVIDADGRCVGVLSSTDFLHFVENSENAVGCRRDASAEAYSAWQMMDVETLPINKVRDYMTPDPVAARPAARISELAQKMVDAHIHRIVIVDEQRRPIGIVSSTDILAAVAQRDAAAGPPLCAGVGDTSERRFLGEAGFVSVGNSRHG